MARRHTFTPGDWPSVARRLDEVVSAHSGEDVFAELLKLVVAKLHTELANAPFAPTSPAELDVLLAAAAWRWPGVLVDAATRLGATEIQAAAAILSVFSLGPDLVALDALFQAIVSRTARGERGQFFTPRPIVRALVARLDLRPGESIVDPACGSGGFLLHALEAQPACEVWGFDNDPRAAAVARTLLIIAGQCPSHVQRLDSLRHAHAGLTIEAAVTSAPDAPPVFAGFDVVLTNPPFAGDVGAALDTGPGGYELAQVGRVERDVLFLERSIGLLRAGGRFAIIVPDNKVSAGRLAFVRDWLIAHTALTEVVGLPRDAFLPYTSQKACVLIGLKRAIPLPGVGPAARDADETVGFRVGFDGPLVIRSLAQLDAGRILTPERYAAAGAGPAAGIGPSAGTGRSVGPVPLGNLVDVLTRSHRPSQLPADRPVLVLDAGHAWEGLVLATHALVDARTIASPKRVVEPGDVIISRLRSYLRQVAYIDPGLFARTARGNSVFVSAEFLVLRAASPTGLPTAALVPFLLSAAVQATLAASEEGGHHPRFRKETLEELGVPPDVVANAQAIAGGVDRAASLHRAAMTLMNAGSSPSDAEIELPLATAAEAQRHGGGEGCEREGAEGGARAGEEPRPADGDGLPAPTLRSQDGRAGVQIDAPMNVVGPALNADVLAAASGEPLDAVEDLAPCPDGVIEDLGPVQLMLGFGRRHQ